MKKYKDVKKLRMRDAVARRPELGYILCGDPRRDEIEDPHTVFFTYDNGEFGAGTSGFDMSTACAISKPEPGLVMLAGAGSYLMMRRGPLVTGNVLDEADPQPEGLVTGRFMDVVAIDGFAYAVGMRGLMYRMTGLNRWEPVDQGLSSDDDLYTVDGFNASDLYAAGNGGRAVHCDGKQWTALDLPTNLALTACLCAPDGQVYFAGNRGMLIVGRGDAWQAHAQEDVVGPYAIRDLDWFDGTVYAATGGQVFRLVGDTLTPVDFGADTPQTCGQLTAGEGVMWSVGEYDIMAFDGTNWSRLV